MSEQNPPAAEQTVTQAVIDRAKQGDREAMSELYKATELEIYRTIHAMIRDEDLVLDVQQDCYLKAFSRLDQLRDASAFLPWLRQIAVNEAKSQLRKKKPLLFSELSDEEEAAEPELPDIRPEASPELALDRRETARLVREILDRLTDSQRLMMGMYYYEQIPVREIADELGLKPGTVKSQLHRGRKLVENEVRALEAKGVKLYGLSPLPFLLALLRRAEPVEEAGGKALASVLREKGAEAVGVRVGRRFFETAAGKLLLGLLTVGVIGGGVAGWRWIQSRAAPLGDVRPPVLMDSAEDLSTEPTIITTAPTEPVTTAPETTTPETTETAEVYESPEELITDPQPTQPQAPEPSQGSSVPTQPRPTEPAPTEPPTTAAPSPIRDWYWSTAGIVRQQTTLYDLPWGRSYEMKIVMDTAIRPQFYSDHPEVVSVSYSEVGNPSGYALTLTSRGPGNAAVYFIAEDEVLTITVMNPEYPVTVLSTKESFYNSSAETPVTSFESCPVNTNFSIEILVQGQTEPVFSTDDPVVVNLINLNSVEDDRTNWIKKGYRESGTIVGPGDAHIYMWIDGVLQKTWTVHAHADPVIEPEPEEGSTEGGAP